MKKDAEYSVHRLRDLDAWSIPVAVMDYHAGHVTSLEINDIERGVVYSVSWATFERLRDTVDYQTWHGVQYYLKLRYWARAETASAQPDAPLQPRLL